MEPENPLKHVRETPTLRDLLASPRLVLHVRRLEEILGREEKRRECFQNEAPVDQKAEFINGEIVVSDSVSRAHDQVKDRLHTMLRIHMRLLQSYQQGEAGAVRGERMLVSLSRNDYEPDLCVFGREKAEHLAPDQWLLPAPDFIVEVLSPSSEKRARGIKFEDYAAHDIGEYWLLDPETEEVEQYVLPASNEEASSASAPGGYELHMKSRSGIVESTVVEGFRTTVEALFDDAANINAMRSQL